MQACRVFRDVEGCCFRRFAQLKQRERVKRATSAGSQCKLEKPKKAEASGEHVCETGLPPAYLTPASRLYGVMASAACPICGGSANQALEPGCRGWGPPRFGRFGVSHACKKPPGEARPEAPVACARREVHFCSHAAVRATSGPSCWQSNEMEGHVVDSNSTLSLAAIQPLGTVERQAWAQWRGKPGRARTAWLGPFRLRQHLSCSWPQSSFD